MYDFSILIAGAAGEGIQTIGATLQRAASSVGWPVFAWQEFESRIRGGNSSYSIRICDANPSSPSYGADVLVALNDSALGHYRKRLNPDGMAVAQCDGEPNGEVLKIPFAKIAEKDFGSKLYANSIATGFAGELMGLDSAAVCSALAASLGSKTPEVIKANTEAATAGREMAAKVGRRHLPPPPQSTRCKRWLLNGHEALAAGAAASGINFIAAYPMSPSTSIITFFAEHQDELGVLVVQAEDEIAAVNMAIGAGFAGARAMTATSGGGFALMVEAISLAGMTETPLVIVLAQRPGPATGLPTRTAQGDLHFAINAGHGEFPKAVLAPADAEDAFLCASRAFELSEKFQTPVVILTDQFLADSTYTLNTIPVVENLSFLAEPGSVPLPYRRYRASLNGVSPRLYPGQSSHLVRADSDEHDEDGHITEQLDNVVRAMAAKRLTKAAALKSAIRPPRQEGPDKPEVTLFGWGSTLHALREAAARLNAIGRPAALVHFTELWPLPEFTVQVGSTLVCVESNATGQLERLLKSEAGLVFGSSIRRFDGLPIDAGYILEAMGEKV